MKEGINKTNENKKLRVGETSGIPHKRLQKRRRFLSADKRVPLEAAEVKLNYGHWSSGNPHTAKCRYKSSSTCYSCLYESTDSYCCHFDVVSVLAFKVLRQSFF